ncbi:ATP-binding protein [Xanthobacteraceae bacterium Astr-EGSB]|uniref:hybrid sensor histidine kinase/response regulator n=1 Tax=Astrobacterium formosum TaxID=3069710 RepID=UPI0027B84246|nr:ATP-binding protein [Xanthobacteraceae bacterium Astr-EGSB]
MLSASVRRLVGVIGVIAALLVAAGLPLGYGLSAYRIETELLSFKARSDAERLSKFARPQGESWRRHLPIAEMPDLPADDAARPVRRRILAGDEVVADLGEALPVPVIVRTAPITADKGLIGRVEIEASMRPLLERTAAIALAGTALAALGLFFLFAFPLRTVDRALGTLSRHDQDTTAQNVRFQAALDNMPQGLCMFDSEQRLTVANRRFLEMHKLPSELSVPGPSLRALLVNAAHRGDFRPDDGDIVDELVADFSRPDETWTRTLEFADGRLIVVSNRRMPGGGWVSVHEDATDRLRVDAQRRRAEAEAMQLRQQERAAELANRAKSEFLATMSHEIRTPMNAVLGLAATLLDADLGAEERATIAAIHESGESLLRILNDVLDYSKIEAGKLAFEELAFSPAILIEHVITVLRPRAQSKQLTLTTEIDPKMPPALVGDAGRLRQVLLNLLSNAVKFTTTGGIVVTARCLTKTSERASVEWTVRDTGIGIEPERLATMFTDFAQTDASIARRYGGSGLGLAISRKIVEQMGGEISVTSSPGTGSTFRVVVGLPWADSLDLGERDDHKSIATLKARIAALGRPLRVLIAEDNPTNQLVTVKMLRQFDVTTHVAADGVEALSALDRMAFDVVLMDIHMPEVDGLQATRMIRKRGGEWLNLPIVALTANAFAQDVKACRDAGMDEFVAKPVRKDVLVTTLVRVLDGRPQAVEKVPAAEKAAHARLRDHARPASADMDDHVITELENEIGTDGVQETLAVFLRETEDRIARLRALASLADRATIRGEAHTLKGAAGTLGLARLSELARTLEKRADGINATTYLAAVESLDAAFREGRAQMPERFHTAS